MFSNSAGLSQAKKKKKETLHLRPQEAGDDNTDQV